MSSLKICAISALLAVPAALHAQLRLDSLNARPISLAEAVSVGEENGLAAVQARGSTRNAESGVRLARGALLPSLSLSLGQTNQSGDRFDNQGRIVPYAAAQPWSYSTGLNSSLNLFDGGRRLNEVNRARDDVAAAQANEVTQKYSVALQIKTQYYAILAAREAEGAANAQLSQAVEQMKSSNARTTAGVATVSDSLRSVVAVGNARLALLTARNNVRVASAALTRLIGSTTFVTAQPADTLDRGLTPIDSASLAQFVDQAPTIRQAEAQLNSARAAVKSSRTGYLPTVDLTFSRSGSGFRQNYGAYGDPFAYSNSFGLRLSYALFNNFTREDALARAETNQDLSEATLRDTRLAAQQTLVQAVSAIRSAQQRILIQEESVKAAQEDLRVQKQRYELGASVLLDVLTSQSTLDAARAALIQARQDVRVARAQLEALVGRDLP